MRMLAYFMRHWRGDQNIAQSLLVNGVLPYLALGTVFLLVYVLTFRPIYLMWVLALFFAWLVWCVVGTTRSAIRTLRSGGSITSKILAIVALVLLVVVLVQTASDALMVARWITIVYRDA
jgi:hypothetical protein